MKVILRLPERRLWRWHAQLIGELDRRGLLEVRLAPSPPYPAGLRAWLALERRVFGAPGLAEAIGSAALPAIDPAAGDGLLVDLTGASDTGLSLRYDGSPDEAALFGALQAGRSPRLEVVEAGGGVRAASQAAVEVRDELGRGLGFVQARLIALVLRALDGPPTPAAPPPPSPGRGRTPLALFAGRAVASKARARLTRGRSRQEDWRIALRPAPPGDRLLDPVGFTPVENPLDVFHADPFLFERDGRVFLFVEAYPWATRKGVIACAELDAAGRPGRFETVLERDIHLSYPQVFAHGGEVFMLPETASARRLELYRATDFPRRWERVATMLEGLRIADATLLFEAGRWWLFASVALHGGASQDELFAWSGPAPTGPWTPHPLNPLVSDVRSGRPGGRFVRCDGRLLRPAQDGEGGYGAGLAWREVETLTPDAYAERGVARWRGADFGRYTGVHSFSEAGGWQAIDLKSPRGHRP